MKKNELKEYRKQTKAEKEAKIVELSNNLTNAYLTKSAHKLTNTALIKNLKKDLAVLKTILKEQELEIKA